MRHTLQVVANPDPPTIRLAELRKQRMLPWLWRRLFGNHKIVVLLSGDSVDEVIITERPDPEGADRMARSTIRLDDEQRSAVEANLGLVGFVLYRTGSHGLPSEDAFQTGLMGLMYAVATFDPTYGTAFSTYAFCCILHELRNERRKYRAIKRGGKARTYSLDAPLEPLRTETGLDLDVLADPAPPLEDAVIDAETSTFIRSVLHRVYPQHADLVDDYLFAELSQPQIAKKYGCSQSTVSLHLRTGLRLLRKYLRGVGYDR